MGKSQQGHQGFSKVALIGNTLFITPFLGRGGEEEKDF